MNDATLHASHSDGGFATLTPAQLPHQAHSHQWLVEKLWLNKACGMIGGQPKCCKSYLALHLAVAVASGRACLNRFTVRQRGPVLLYAAEDAQPILRQRIAAIASACSAPFESLDIHIIDSPTLHIDRTSYCSRLYHTIERIAPTLLILDPLVRLHHRNENHSAEITPVLELLRHLQRIFQTAVVLVHHTGKTAHQRAGQSLRGTSG